MLFDEECRLTVVPVHQSGTLVGFYVVLLGGMRNVLGGHHRIFGARDLLHADDLDIPGVHARW